MHEAEGCTRGSSRDRRLLSHILQIESFGGSENMQELFCQITVATLVRNQPYESFTQNLELIDIPDQLDPCGP